MKWNLNTKKFTFAGKGLTCGVQVGTKSPQGLLLFLMAIVLLLESILINSCPV